jgi:hypothetical protein
MRRIIAKIEQQKKDKTNLLFFKQRRNHAVFFRAMVCRDAHVVSARPVELLRQ